MTHIVPSHRRRAAGWLAPVALLFCFSLALSPLCAQDAPPAPPAEWSENATAAQQVLKSICSAEETLWMRAKAYGDLKALRAARLCPLGEGQVDAVSGYRFLSVAGPNTYTIVALPPQGETAAFAMVESGTITSRKPSGAQAALRRARTQLRQDAAIDVLRRVRSAQRTYRQKKKVYGTLGDLRAAGLIDLVDDRPEARSGYRFRCVATRNTYTITAFPPAKDMRAFQTDETGTVTH